MLHAKQKKPPKTPIIQIPKSLMLNFNKVDHATKLVLYFDKKTNMYTKLQLACEPLIYIAENTNLEALMKISCV